MTNPKSDQRRLSAGGREFHFVSYEEQAPNVRRGEPGHPPMWFLMSAGKRWPVMPQVDGQDPDEVNRALLGWLELNVLGNEAAPEPPRGAEAPEDRSALTPGRR